ncbi:hypothetical protein SAMN03080601_01920 [Alkalitalea saponilacus]|uniref:Uncharacterized protein n=1 Tax=Alkalitalea saponilacus TaxID=889453 RepID=A0A1T5GPV6_9BACT|nr:hypothetical protein SAMN03080601_01920 [Alkalitalea saponilacus]
MVLKPFGLKLTTNTRLCLDIIRVTKKPAEKYYTCYGDTIHTGLGNLPEIEFVLPVYYQNKEFWDLKLTPVKLYTFHDIITEDRQEEILDSLITNDKLITRQLFPGEDWSPYSIYVTKTSPEDPYTLYHRYYKSGFFESN